MIETTCYELSVITEGLVRHGPFVFPTLDEALDKLFDICKGRTVKAVRMNAVTRVTYFEWPEKHPW